MENTTQLFLGVRFNCNHCHDHPFERWTQGQYYHLAAYFAQVGRKEDPLSQGRTIGASAVEGGKPLVEAIYDAPSGEVLNGATNKPATPGFPYAHAEVSSGEATRRQQLARWIASKENQYFAKSYVNRLWGYLFGRGIIEPIDDIRAGNPPTNPELLDRLTADFVASGFDMQHTLRTICKSRAYQASIATNKWNEDDEINFSHAIARRLPAEVLYDAIQRATGSVSHLPGVPAGYRAAQLPDVGLTLPSGFFEVFGRAPRESSCECERSSGMMLGPVMTLVNGPTIAEAIADPANEITRLVASQTDDTKLVDELFVRILSRSASEAEIAAGIAALKAGGDELAKLQADLASHQAQLDAQQPAWEASQTAPVWTALEAVELQSSAGATFAKQADQSVLVEGPNARGTYTIKLNTDLANISAVRLELLADAKLPAGGPGRAPNGNLVLSELKATATAKSDPAKTAAIAFAAAVADHNQDGYPIANAFDGNAGTGWAIAPNFGKDTAGIFQLREPVSFEGGATLTLVLDHQFDEQHSVGKFRVSVTDAKQPLNTQKTPANIATILAVPPANRTDSQRAELASAFRALDAKWVALSQSVAAVAEQQKNARLTGAQDLAWALINSPSFLFNR